jgi:autotransporter-associated beta strand protein
MSVRNAKSRRAVRNISVAVAPVLVALGGAAPVRAEILNGNTTLTGSINGQQGSGFMLESGTLSVSNATLFNFRTVGGAGSGGGAGLGGAIFIAAGAAAVLDNVNFAGNTAVGGLGGTTSLTGGVLNGMLVSGGDGATGSSGTEYQDNASLFGDGQGDGVAGTGGGNGGNSSTGFGGAGGVGGTGSDGWSENPILIAQVASATAEVVNVGAAATAAAADPITAPIAAGLAAQAVQAGIDEGVDSANLAAWNIANDEGELGHGGAGGNGGNGGNGAWGFGGGAGGDGGVGGSGGGGATNGVGGSGGTGGSGGFGGGGGGGGDGGAANTGGNGGGGTGTAGLGGAAGFGGGVGSSGTGAGVATTSGGGGGAGYGGSIFVEAGGALTITGNATFANGNVVGGSSLNGGAAGGAAGSDLFMMTGSNVVLDPGQGNVITFNGSIADDSVASIPSSNATGQGAGITINSGLVVFNGADTYSGQTTLQGGVLQAVDGQGLNGNSNLDIAGGTFQSSGTFDRFVGSTSERVQWTGSGGFAGMGGGLTISLAGGSQLTWNQGGFVPDGSALQFGATAATAGTTFTNAIDLAGGNRTISVISSPLAPDDAVMSGVLSDGALTVNDGVATGRLVLTAADTYAGSTTINSGTLALSGAGSIAASSGVIDNGSFDISATNAGASITTLSGGGQVNLGSQTLTLTQAGDAFAGSIGGTGNLAITGGSEALAGANTYSGQTQVGPQAGLFLLNPDSIASSARLVLNGFLGADGGARITSLAGTGNVFVGEAPLVLSNPADSFAGSIAGPGGLSVEAGTETLTGNNVYTGVTAIDGGTLALSGTGSIAQSSSVMANGTLDISGTTAGAAVVSLGGGGQVNLGGRTLTVTNGVDSFAGSISGSGGLTVAGGTQTLAGANGYTGQTTISGGTLALTGSGSIASSARVLDDAVLDLGNAAPLTSITTLAGSGSVLLGSNDLALTAAADSFAGGIAGAGRLFLQGGTETLTGANSYTGPTYIEQGRLALAGTGSIQSSFGVDVAGTLDISGTTEGAAIQRLAGNGTVRLGGQTLSITTGGQSDFAGTIGGTGGLTVSAGSQVLSGSNTYTGTTRVDAGSLALTGSGSIAASAGVVANGTFDISGTSAGASITTLSGSGTVALGGQTLTLTQAGDSFAGGITGSGGLTLTGGTETLTGANFYTGATSIRTGTLALAGSGSIAASSGVAADGTLDISGTTAGAAITTLSGAGSVALGGQTLTLTRAGDSFAGQIGGSGGLAITGGTETLTGSNGYTGPTSIVAGTLALAGQGSIAASSGVAANGTFDISATPGASITSLSGSGLVNLGAQTLTLTQASDDFAGSITGSGGLGLAGGTQTLSGSNTYTGPTAIGAGTLALAGTGSIAASSGVALMGTLDISGTTNGASITTLSGNGTVALGDQVLTLTRAAGSFAGSIGGSGGLAITGGSETLTGSSSFTGGTAVSNATLAVSGDAALGAPGGGLALTNATLQPLATFASARQLTLSGSGTINTNQQSVALSGTIGGSGGLVAAGGGQLTLSGSNAYTGGTLVTGNTTLAVGSDAALGAPSAPLTIDSGKLLALDSFSSTRPITVNLGGTIDSNGYTLNLTGPINLENGAGTMAPIFSGTGHVIGPLYIDQSGLLIGSSSMLRGTGMIYADTNVYGTLAPGNSPGTLTFVAPVTLQPASVLELDIDGTGTGTEAGNYSRVIVQGSSFAAAGTIEPVLRGITGDATNSYTPPVGQEFQVVRADGGVTGSFQGLAEPASGLAPGSRFDALYTPTAVNLYVTPASYTDLSPFGIRLTPNQVATGAAVDALRPTPGLRTDPATSAVLAPLFSQTPAGVSLALASMNGTIYGDTLLAGLERGQEFAATIAEQQAERRGAPSAPSSTVAGGRITSWISGLGQNLSVGGSDGTTSYSSSSGGVAAGTDVRLGGGLLAGFAAGYSDGRTTSAATGSNADLQLGNLSLYGSWSPARFYVDAQAGVSYSDLQAHRSLAGLGLTARGSNQDVGDTAGVEVGTRLSLGRVSLRPDVAISLDQLGRGNLQEAGAGPVSLSVRGDRLTSLRASLGVRAETSFALAPGYRLTPSATLQLAHELGDVTTTTTASFAGVPAQPIAVQSARTGRDGALVGFGTALALPGRVAIYATYAADLRSHLTSQVLQGGVRLAW